jgi:hypothetical protein
MYSNCGLGASITIGTDGITFHGNGHSLTGSVTDKGVHIYEKSNVKVTDLKISSFSEGHIRFTSPQQHHIMHTKLLKSK